MSSADTDHCFGINRNGQCGVKPSVAHGHGGNPRFRNARQPVASSRMMEENEQKIKTREVPTPVFRGAGRQTATSAPAPLDKEEEE